MKAVGVGLENLNIISDEAYDQVQETMKQAANKIIAGEGKPRMALSEYHFEAYMRWLDSQVNRIVNRICFQRKLYCEKEMCFNPTKTV